jgi:hypothetical protein
MWSLFRSRLLAVPPPPVGSQRRCPGNMLAYDARRPHFIDVVWGVRCEQIEKSPEFNQIPVVQTEANHPKLPVLTLIIYTTRKC